MLFSCSVMSNSLQPHRSQHARLPCPSPFPGVCSNSCPLSQWGHPTISSSVIPFSCLSQWDGSSHQVAKVLASISPSSEYSMLLSFRIDWFDLLAVQGTLKSLLQHHSLKASVLCPSAFSMVHLSHPYILFLFNHSVMSNSLWPHVLPHTRLPCPSPSPGACPNSCPLSRWCHPAISSSVIPFSSCLQYFPASGSFLMSWLFASDNQSIGASWLLEKL